MCTGDVPRYEGITLSVDLRYGVKYPELFFFITPEPCEVLRQNFGPVNKIITLGTFLGQKHTPSLAYAHVGMTHYETWPHFTDLLLCLAFYIEFLVYKIGDMLRPWNFLKNAFWQKKLIGDTIINFRWSYQKFIPGLHNTNHSRDIVNDITNRHLFIRGIPGTSFKWDTMVMTYAFLYTHTILEKVVRWKFWYYFQSLILRYSPENLPHLLTLFTCFTWWHWYFCLCIRRVTEALKCLSYICKNLLPIFLKNLIEVNSFYFYWSILSKQNHSTCLSEKMQLLCFNSIS